MIMALISIGRSSRGASLPDVLVREDEVSMLVLVINVIFGGASRDFNAVKSDDSTGLKFDVIEV